MLSTDGKQRIHDKTEAPIHFLYQVSQSRPVQFLDMRSQVLLHLPVLVRCTVRDACRLVAASYGCCPDDEVTLEFEGRVLDPDSPLPEKKVFEAVIEPGLPLWVRFELKDPSMAAPLPLTFSFPDGAKFSDAAARFGNIMHIQAPFVKFWSDAESVIPHKNPIAN
jgi:hypothetical protein